MSGGRILEERQGDEKEVGKNEANAGIVRYVRYDETHWTGSVIFAEALDGSGSLNSWTSWRRQSRYNHPTAHPAIDRSRCSCSPG